MIKSAKYGDKLWVINFDKVILCRVIRTYAVREKRVKLKVIHEGMLGSLHAKFEDCFRTKLQALYRKFRIASKDYKRAEIFYQKCAIEYDKELNK